MSYVVVNMSEFYESALAVQRIVLQNSCKIVLKLEKMENGQDGFYSKLTIKATE